ncbi:hypothetical protein LINPERHAP1_LOCUS4969, partial [Linum perenne]
SKHRLEDGLVKTFRLGKIPTSRIKQPRRAEISEGDRGKKRTYVIYVRKQ